MRQALKDQICRAILTTVKRTAGRDPIEIAERIGDAVELIYDMHAEESGIASIPPALQEPEAWDMDKMEPAKPPRPTLDIPPSRRAVMAPPAAPGGKLIALPGDPEFAQAKPADLPERKVISALDFQRRAIDRPGANVSEKQYWSEFDLIEAVNQNTPDQVEFEVEGPEGYPIKLKAIKNVINQQGMGSVVLTYRHPSVSEQTDGNVTVDLIAKVPFSLYAKEVDIDLAMDGPKGIMMQLQGMYKARPSSMAPVAGPEPAMLSRSSLRTSPMQDGVEVSSEYDDNGRLVNPGGRIERDSDGNYIPRSGEVYERSSKGMRQNNDSLAPIGHRFGGK